MADQTIPPPPPGFTLDAPQPSMFGGRPVIQEGPPQREPKDHFSPLPKTDPRFRPEYPSAQVNDTTGEINFGPQSSEPPGHAASKQQAMEATRELIGSIQKAKGYINDAKGPFGNTATGLGYNLLHNSPVATDASQLDSTIKGEIQGNIFKSWMSAMKAATDKGGSVFGGRIMQSEIPFIVNSLGTLTPGKLHTDTMLGNLTQVENNVIRSAAMLNNENPDDPRVIQKYQQMLLPPPAHDNSAVGAGQSGQTPPGGPPPNGPTRLNPAQQQHFFSVLEHQGPDAADAYLRQFGIALKDKNAAAGPHSEQIDYPSQLGHSFAVGLGGVAQGVGDALGVVSNPFVKGVNAVAGTNFNPDAGVNLRDTLGLPAPQNDQEYLANRINDYGTQALGFAGAAKAVASHIPGIVGTVLESFGNHPLTDSASGASGGAASEGVRQAGGGPIAQTAAALAAGVPTAALGMRTNALMERTPGLVPQVVNAGKQEGVSVPRAMAYPSLAPEVTATGKTMTGAKMMGRDMRSVSGQIQGRVRALDNGGSKLEPYNLGETAQNIGQRYIKSSGADFGKQYTALRTASVGVQIPAQQSIADVDAILKRLSATPTTNAKEISYLQGVRSDLARGLDVESARDIGSKLSSDISKGDVTFGKAEADVLGIRKAISQDIANGLTNAGKGGVARSFKQVDAAYSHRMDFIKNTIQKLTGPRGAPLAPEAAATRIKAWASAKGDSSSLGKIMAQATPEEQADIGATFADALGKNRKGEFSTALLADNIEALPARARQILFGPDGAKSLNNIQMLAKEHSRVMGSLGGSPTALAGDARGWMMRLIFGAGGSLLEAGAGGGLTGSAIAGAATTAGLTGAKVARDALSARALMSTKLTGWLRSAPKTADPQAINAWYDRLKVIAVREPALAPEVKRIQDAFMGAANSNLTPSAAASQADQANQNN